MVLEELFDKVKVRPDLSQIKASTLEVICFGMIYHVTFKLHFCADLKFLYTALNLTGANSTFSCPICTCPKDRRLQNHRFKETHRRTFEKIQAESCYYCDETKKALKCETKKFHGGKSKKALKVDGTQAKIVCPDKQHGKKGRNLLNDLVDESHIWIDTLHMEMRLTDRSETFMQEQAVQNGKVRELENAILTQCGLSYKSRKSKTSRGK